MAIALSLAILVLFLLALLNMGIVGPGGGGKGTRLVAMNVSEEKKEEQPKSSPKKVEVTRPAAAAPKPAPLQKPDPTPAPPPTPAPGPPGFIHMSHADMASADISKMPQTASAGGAAGAGPKEGGEGPGGAVLYNARWYREPSDAELGPYLKGNAPMGAFAIIACRTVEHYHVEDCEEMEESPRGSGLARGLRQAAWQFLVWPPRIDGKPQLGTWVRIRFDFTRSSH